jgi:hypothetical protein
LSGWLGAAVTRRQMVVAVLLAAGLWLLAVSGGAWWVHQHWWGQAHITDQPVSLSLPDLMRASADVHSIIHTRLKSDVVVNVPLDQVVDVRVPDTLTGTTRIQTSVPVDTEVSYEANVPVETQVTAEVPVVSWLPSMTVTVPLAFSVPVHVTVPFKASVPLVLDLQATADLPDVLRLPVHARIPLTVPLNQPIEAEVVSRTQFELHGTDVGIPVTIADTLMRMPLSDLRFQPNKP